MSEERTYMKPWVFEFSNVPVWASYVAPIQIGALSFGPFVFFRGQASETRLRHETIHYHQQLELLFIFQWLLYLLFWLWGVLKYRDGKKAYYENPFEREAYDNEKDVEYLTDRPMYSWVYYA